MADLWVKSVKPSVATTKAVLLFGALLCNVLWSYMVMHLGRLSSGDLSDPLLTKFVPYYMGYTVVCLIMIIIPQVFGHFYRRGSQLVVTTLIMISSTMLISFSFGQTVFDQNVLSVVGNFIAGIACSFTIASVYLPLLLNVSRKTFFCCVLFAHILKRAISVRFDTVDLGVAAAITACILPVTMTLLIWVANRQASTVPVSPKPIKPIFRETKTWLFLIAVAFAVIGCDYFASTDVWMLSNPFIRQASTQSVVVFPIECIIAFTLGLSAIGVRKKLKHQTISLRYREVFPIAIICLLPSTFHLDASTGIVQTAATCAVGAIAIYMHAISWAVTYDCVKETRASFFRVYGLMLLAETILILIWGLIEHVSTKGMQVSNIAYGALIFYGMVAFGFASQGTVRTHNFETTQTQKLGMEVLPLKNSSHFHEINQALQARCADLAALHGLSERELDVLVLAAQGRTRQTICMALSLSEGTVKSHIAHIYTKLGIHSQSDLADMVYGASENHAEKEGITEFIN